MNTQEIIITWATPVFFALIALELLVAKLRGRCVYHSSDAINSLGLGVISQIVAVFSKLLTLGIYAWCVQHLALFALPANSVWVWVTALVFYDFCYYWLHRAGHEVNILWAAHVVHHQSEDYNLSTALRQTGSGVLLGWLFYLPMAVVGYPLEVFVVVALIDLLYQFWVHTELVGRLGWFDRVFCSPSNHRAHHAVNDRYLDRNYGGILILWDRLFGTFIEEDDSDPPVYGTRSPLRSWNPLWANAEVYWATAKDAWHARRWRDKLLVWIKPPGWRPADVAQRFPKPAFDIGRERYLPVLSRGLTVYSLLQFALLLGMAVQFLDLAKHLAAVELVGYAVFLVLSLSALGALTEGRRVGVALELVRLLVTAAIPLLTGGWFGVPRLDGHVVAALVAVPLLSALVLGWLAISTATREGSEKAIPG
ncbi:Sterol desaturase/sphingolipid hydroxylase, fatty acid hydroxylase superfamily [Dyella jiangningensis]|uniref:sterol desaturase family protein n=1 Tax=Dyella sp. AtDHG13 TaxID=1938897 RepID=UPI00088D6B7F|nr:sterol desaturase family protein [Dyella sp. AtDHG13]PXV59003.1 sterol desaturase/sphingolipid hydroxylase (fatty acid hydroxylase superfamily) [Dyella sp. AtDHG13]SDL30046.1 Sterol desaturase/sphingolipid hydroxylase, fatty acid hydroxylase superfamily [Dyella jiangningensis]